MRKSEGFDGDVGVMYCNILAPRLRIRVGMYGCQFQRYYRPQGCVMCSRLLFSIRKFT